MPKETDIQGEKRQIKDLTEHDPNIVYSLVRIGDWADLELGGVYKLTAEDARKVFDNYVELLEAAENKPPVQQHLPQDPSPERIEKPRKCRSDAKYATTAERQAAYRDRMKGKSCAGLEQPASAKETGSRSPADSEVVCSGRLAHIAETNAQYADTEPWT